MAVFRRSLECIMSPDKKETVGFIAIFKSSKATASSSSPIKDSILKRYRLQSPLYPSMKTKFFTYARSFVCEVRQLLYPQFRSGCIQLMLKFSHGCVHSCSLIEEIVML